MRHLLIIWEGRQEDEKLLCQRFIAALKNYEDCNLLVARIKTILLDDGVSFDLTPTN